MTNFTYISKSEEETQLLGEAISQLLTRDSLLLLNRMNSNETVEIN